MASRVHFGPQPRAFSSKKSKMAFKIRNEVGSLNDSYNKMGADVHYVAQRSTRLSQAGAKQYLANKAHEKERASTSHKLAGVKTGLAIGGAAAVGYGGYKAYQHRDEIRQKATQVSNKVHNTFHSTHQAFGHQR